LAEERAFDGVITSPLTGRSSKPRTQGETMVIDKGLGLSQVGDMLELGCDFIDYIKFGFGTAALYSRAVLRAKIALITSYGVSVYPGGTFLEIAVAQDRLDEYLERSQKLGFTHIEMSVRAMPNCFRYLVLPIPSFEVYSGKRRSFNYTSRLN